MKDMLPGPHPQANLHLEGIHGPYPAKEPKLVAHCEIREAWWTLCPLTLSFLEIEP